MGLIKAALVSASSSLGDQFKEFVTCPEMEGKVLIQRGEVSHGSGNRNASEGVITNGSGIVVPAGMAMMIVENGAITEFTAESGTYKYDTSSEPSVFTGGFGKGIIDTIKTIGSRITYGGATAKDQRVYYVNIKNIPGNLFGSPNPKKITDEKYGMLEVTFNGEYVVKCVDPAKLVASVIGANAKDTVTYDEAVGSIIKGKFIEKLTYALTVVMRKHKVSFGDIGMYGSDISTEMNTCLDEDLKETYGMEIVDVALNDVNLTDESMERVSKIDDARIFSNTSMQSGLMASATADAMKSAASNENGSMMGFMGMNMAQGTGATMMGAINNNGEVEAKETNTPEPGTLFSKEEEKTEFCPDCGTKKVGKFCTNCGKKLED